MNYIIWSAEFANTEMLLTTDLAENGMQLVSQCMVYILYNMLDQKF